MQKDDLYRRTRGFQGQEKAMTDEEMIEHLAAHKALTEMCSHVYLEPVPITKRSGIKVDIVGFSGNLRIVIQPGYEGGTKKPEMTRSHSTIQALFRAHHPEADLAAWSDAGTSPDKAAVAAGLLQGWLRSSAAKDALTKSWEIALAGGE